MLISKRSANFPFVLLLLALLQLAACRSVEPPASYDALVGGDEQYFFTAWNGDQSNQQLQTLPQYMDWVVRFYNGAGNVPGWTQMTGQVLARLPVEQQNTVAPRLALLGRRIGAEWAKDNSVRLVDTGAVAAWRDALLEALAQNDLDTYLGRLTADLDALLNHQLQSDAIRFERYYKDEFDN